MIRAAAALAGHGPGHRVACHVLENSATENRAASQRSPAATASSADPE